MSITAGEMQILLNGGFDVQEFILVARAMESGDDRRWMTHVLDAVRAENASDRVLAVCMVTSAQEILARRPQPRVRDLHTAKRDSNKARRNMPDSKWRQLRGLILERDEYCCQYCGSDCDLTVDHVVPLFRGGGNDPENLTAACRPCNSSKGDKLLSEWQGR